MGSSQTKYCRVDEDDMGALKIRNLQCTLKRHACFQCQDGSPDLRYHPFLVYDEVERTYSLKKDMVKPSVLQQTGVFLWGWKVLIAVALSIGLAFLQGPADLGIPRPFGGSFFSLIAGIIFGAYFFARFTFLIGRVNNAAQAFYDLEDGAVSFAQYMNSLLTEDDLQRWNDIEVKLTKWNAQGCSTVKREISASAAYCELAYITAALGYAVINDNRDSTKLDINKLPISDYAKMELAYRVGVTNPDYLGVMFQMMTERAEALENEGLYGSSKHRELTGQINGLNSTVVTIDKIATIAPAALVNQFLMAALYIYLVFIVWTFGYEPWWVNVIFAFVFQVIVLGVLSLADAEGLPFDNTETNPYSTVPVQDRKHTLASAALGASLSLFDRLSATVPIQVSEKPSSVGMPIPAQANLSWNPGHSSRTTPGYQTSSFA